MKRKLLIFIILLLSFIIKNVKADSIYHLNRQTYDDIYFVQNGLPEHYMSDIQFTLSLDNVVAFCLDPKMPITTYNYSGFSLSETNYDKDIIDYLNKVIYYGYEYPNHQNIRYYMATQALIWEKMSPYIIQFYTEQYGYGDYIDISYEKGVILDLIDKHYDVPYFSNKSYNYTTQPIIEFEDDILTEFEIIESSWKDTFIEENKLKIKNLDNFIGNINIKLRKKSYRNDESKYYYSGNSQSLVTGGKIEQPIVNLDINITSIKLTINKLDSISKLPLKNSKIVFNIKNIDKNEYIYVNETKDLSVNEEGTLIVENLPYGTYEIMEIKTEDGYKLNDESVIVMIDDTTSINSAVELNIYNERKKGSIELIKIDSDSKKTIEGVEFTLYAAEDIVTKDKVIHYKKGEDVFKIKTDINGKILFSNLELGKYCIKETSILKDYIENKEQYCFDLYKNKDANIMIENELKKGQIKIKKYGEVFNYINNEYIFNVLENVEFEIFAKEDIITSDLVKHYSANEIIYNKKTDSNGEIVFDDLVLGNYCIKEKSANNNYIINNQEYCFNLYDKSEVEIEVYNYLKKSNLKIKKIDSISLEPLDNVTFEIFHNNESLGQYTTNLDGIIELKDLPLSTYEIKEIKTKDNYIINNNKNVINLNLNEEIVITNDRIINIPNALKNDYTKIILTIVFIIGVGLNFYDKKKS